MIRNSTRLPRVRRRWALAAVLVAGLVAGLASASGAIDPDRPAAPPPAGQARAARFGRPVPAELAISPRSSLIPVPHSFMGLSTEYWSLPLWSSQTPLLEHVMAMLHVPGDGPMVLRVGGDSADHSFWDPRSLPMPHWAFSLAPDWLTQLSEMVNTLHVRLILDLNLITDSPAEAAIWAQAAEAGLPHGSIAAFEVGNEPDIYSRADWLEITAGKQYLGRPLPLELSPRSYVRDFRTYGGALDEVAPHVTLAGPALARPQVHDAWVKTLIADAGRSLGLITIHRYPYSGCVTRHNKIFPTIARVLSPQASIGMAERLRPEIDAAHDAGLPIRMTELNSVNCGGRPGVSNSFATALWAPTALFSLLHAGIDGVNVHVRANTINAPFALNSAGLTARPLLYGLILFARSLGPEARVVPLSLRTPRAPNLHAYAVRTGPDTLHVVLIDEGTRSVRVSLRLPATGAASVQRLLAPSAGAQTGVTLGGEHLAANGSWVGAGTGQAVARRDGVYTVAVRHASAALISVAVAPGALGVPGAGRAAHRAGATSPGAELPASPSSTTRGSAPTGPAATRAPAVPARPRAARTVAPQGTVAEPPSRRALAGRRRHAR